MLHEDKLGWKGDDTSRHEQRKKPRPPIDCASQPSPQKRFTLGFVSLVRASVSFGWGLGHVGLRHPVIDVSHVASG
jgi:hypothetical protein